MKAVLQRVSKVSVKVNNEVISTIDNGILVLLGISTDDAKSDIDWLSNKIVNLRIFNDENDIMNKSVKEIDGDIIVVSQFTLLANTKKGNRPSYINAARPETAVPLYEEFVKKIESDLNKPVGTGVFGADMKIDLLNDGPVTIIIDTHNK